MSIDGLEGCLRSASLLFVLLNPFLMTIYLLDLVERLSGREFARVLLRAAAISTAVFAAFAWIGEFLLEEVLQVRFASFLIFGGVVFVIVGLRFVFEGHRALNGMRGEPQHVAGAIAMPFMIGPGTLSASVIAGSRNPAPLALLAIVAAMGATVLGVLGLKWLHGRARRGREALVDRYVEVVGRLSALVIGTFAVEMILQGLDAWRSGA